MKNLSLFIVSAVFGCASVSLAGKASDLKLSAPAITFMGSAPAGTKVSLLVVYTPDTTVKQDMSQCKFPEDKYSPNGSDLMFEPKASNNSDGKYLVAAPLRGIRKSCKYIFSNIYMYVDLEPVYLPLQLKSDEQVAQDHAFEKENGFELTQFKKFEDIKEMTCDFKEYGICKVADGYLPDLGYHVSTKEQTVTFDIKEE
jgi:hypothetical protein